MKNLNEMSKAEMEQEISFAKEFVNNGGCMNKEGLIRRLVAEANQNDPNWKWSIKAINKTVARIFWSYLEYGDQKPCFTIELVEDEDGCLIYAKDEHGDNLNVEMVECVGLPSLNTPIEEAIKMMAYTIINTAHACY